MRAQNPPVPLPHKNIGAVDETVGYAHVAQTLFGVLELLEELEVSGRYNRFTCGETLHIFSWLSGLRGQRRERRERAALDCRWDGRHKINNVF